MKKTFFFMAGIAVGLCTSLVAAQGAGSIPILNASGAYIELVTLVPGQGSGQHAGIPGEVGIVAEGEVVLSSPAGRKSLMGGQCLLVTGTHPARYSQRKQSASKGLRHCDEAMRLTATLVVAQLGSLPGFGRVSSSVLRRPLARSRYFWRSSASSYAAQRIPFAASSRVGKNATRSGRFSRTRRRTGTRRQECPPRRVKTPGAQTRGAIP